MTGLSNVTGESFPLKEVGALAKSHDALFLVDGAQAGGHIPLDIKSMNISLLALASPLLLRAISVFSELGI